MSAAPATPAACNFLNDLGTKRRTLILGVDLAVDIALSECGCVDALLQPARVLTDDHEDAVERAVHRASELAAPSSRPDGRHLLAALCMERRTAAYRCIDQCGTKPDGLGSDAMRQVATASSRRARPPMTASPRRLIPGSRECATVARRTGRAVYGRRRARCSFGEVRAGAHSRATQSSRSCRVCAAASATWRSLPELHRDPHRDPIAPKG